MPTRKTYAEMTAEERAALQRARARTSSPEHIAEDDRVRALVEAELKGRRADPDLAEALADLRRERERQGLTLADLSERTGIDKATLSKLETGKMPNPTVGTLKIYATALGKRLAWSLQTAR